MCGCTGGLTAEQRREARLKRNAENKAALLAKRERRLADKAARDASRARAAA